MIIDVHAHVLEYPKILPSPRATTTFMSAEQQIALMDSKGVDKAVILPLNNPETMGSEKQSIGEVLHICEKYPGRFIPFCNIDPRLAKRPDLIKVEDYLFFLNQYKQLGCKGLGEITARIYFDDPSLLLLFEACEEVGFPVTFHTITADVDSYGVIDEINFPRFEKVLQKFPKLNFFAHSAGWWAEISGDATLEEKNWYPEKPVVPGGRIKYLMRTYPNLYGDISARSGLNAFQRDPEHAWEFIDEFQDRLMLGLDYCSPTNNMQHIEWFTKAKDDGNISSKVYDKIMWGNINRVLNLGL